MSTCLRPPFCTMRHVGRRRDATNRGGRTFAVIFFPLTSSRGPNLLVPPMFYTSLSVTLACSEDMRVTSKAATSRMSSPDMPFGSNAGVWPALISGMLPLIPPLASPLPRGQLLAPPIDPVRRPLRTGTVLPRIRGCMRETRPVEEGVAACSSSARLEGLDEALGSREMRDGRNSAPGPVITAPELSDVGVTGSLCSRWCSPTSMAFSMMSSL